MPQMSPLSWWILFVYFIILLVLFSVMNYYVFFYTPRKSETLVIHSKSMNWKW